MGILPTTRHAIKPTFFEHDVPSHRGAPQRRAGRRRRDADTRAPPGIAPERLALGVKRALLQHAAGSGTQAGKEERLVERVARMR